MSRWIPALLAALSCGCFGQSELQLSPTAAAGRNDAEQVRLYSCDAARTPVELPLRRLSHRQYLRTVQAWVRDTALSEADREAVLAAVADPLQRYPEDRKVGAPADTHGGFTQLDQAVQQAHVDATYEVATTLGRELTSTAIRRSALLGPCATDAITTNDDGCLRDFISSFGGRVLRRALSAEDVGFYRETAGTTPVAPEAVADVIGLLLTSPEALYLVELPLEPSTEGPAQLDAFSLASRLSYHFWQAPPDEALLEAARSGALLTQAGFRAEVDRLFADPRTDATVRDFFSQWFRLDELQPLNTRVGTPMFDAFAGEHVPSATLHVEMQDEIRDLVTWLARSGGSVGDVLTNRQSFARTPSLAALYGEAPWDGLSEPAVLSQPERTGLLTRAALLASPSGNTRPIMKGYHVRTALLCQPIPPPPDNAMAMPVAPAENATTRETVAQLTEQRGSSCAGCHQTLLNPLGYVTEGFDALGRQRTHERLYDLDGVLRGERAVDTSTHLVLREVKQDVKGPGEVTELMAATGAFESCFAQQYFRFAFGRVEDPATDGCVLSALETAAQEGRPLAEVLQAVALQPAFQRKDFR